MLVVLGACKGSPRSTSTGSATEPQKTSGLVAKSSLTAAQMPGMPLDARVVTKTLSVNPPASFDTDQLGQSGVVAFLVSGTARQILLVKLNKDDAGEVFIQPPGPDRALIPYGDNRGNLLFSLPRTGPYRVLFEPQPGASIQFRFIANDDPMIDPGIKSDQISADLAPFAQRNELSVVPYANFEGDEDEFWPSHLAVQHDHFEFRIMSTVLYKQLFPQDHSIELLEGALKEDLSAVRVEELPYSRETRWCGYVMTARRTVLKGSGWRGLRWIGGFGGDEDYPSCGLGYVFNGITNDGRFLIVVRADISHPDLKRLALVRQIQQAAHGSWESSDPKADAEMRARLEKSLALATPDSFEPNLAMLDAVVKSLRLRP
jgi:hypothetical protein